MYKGVVVLKCYWKGMAFSLHSTGWQNVWCRLRQQSLQKPYLKLDTTKKYIAMKISNDNNIFLLKRLLYDNSKILIKHHCSNGALENKTMHVFVLKRRNSCYTAH